MFAKLTASIESTNEQLYKECCDQPQKIALAAHKKASVERGASPLSVESVRTLIIRGMRMTLFKEYLNIIHILVHPCRLQSSTVAHIRQTVTYFFSRRKFASSSNFPSNILLAKFNIARRFSMI